MLHPYERITAVQVPSAEGYKCVVTWRTYFSCADHKGTVKYGTWLLEKSCFISKSEFETVVVS